MSKPKPMAAITRMSQWVSVRRCGGGDEDTADSRASGLAGFGELRAVGHLGAGDALERLGLGALHAAGPADQQTQQQQAAQHTTLLRSPTRPAWWVKKKPQRGPPVATRGTFSPSP